jgi:beta-galactosidase
MLFTSDNPEHHMLQGGSIPGALMTLNFGSGPEERFPILDEYQQESPYMCAEFWIGWFDTWGGKHNTGAPAKEVADTLDKMLNMGASVNFYMFHGGTNFGFTNGANKSKSSYEPDVTSYDYGALLDEAGDPTEKYYLCRDILAKYVEGVNKTKKFLPTKKVSYGKVKLTEQVNMFNALDMLSTPIKKTVPVPMELLDQDMGFIHYTTFLSGPRKEDVIYIQEIHDRALLFINRKLVKTFQYNENNEGFKLTVPKEGLTIDILVESMGRVNYGPLMKDYKGITEGVRYAYQFLFDWTIYSLPLDNIEKLKFEPIKSMDGPSFFRGLLEVDEIADTFITLNNFTKGNVFINGFNLGRYWDIGPQRTLYVPAPLLKKGKNEIVVFELHSTKEAVVEFNDRLILE